VNIVARIRNNRTGEIREVPSKDYCDDLEAEYLWGEGNYACDCHRAAIFDRRGNPDIKCGETRFAVEIVAPNGKTIYSDFTARPMMVKETA
jgi:hypothetical protein